MKYIIEFEDEPSFCDGETVRYKCLSAKWWSASDLLINRLEPLTKDSAYQKGYEEGFAEGRKRAELQGESDYDTGYNAGFNAGQMDVSTKTNTETVRETLYMLIDMIDYYKRITSLPDCNTCAFKNEYGICPKPGEQTRINCAYWNENKEGGQNG